MAISITHTFVSAIADGADATLVRPSDWNAVHTFADIAPLASPSFTGLISIDADAILVRDAANTLALRNAANAQKLKIYTSYTDASNYERFAITTAAGTITLSAETLGTGTDNIDLILAPVGTGQVKIDIASVTKFTFSTAGKLLCTSLDLTSTIQCDNYYGYAVTGPMGLNPRNYSGTTAKVVIAMAGGTNSSTASQQTAVSIIPTYNQASGTASNTDLLINRTQTLVGSGTQLLIDAQVSTVSKFSVNNVGNVNLVGVLSVSGTQVVGARVIDARCDDAVNSGDATTDGVIDALRDAMIAHGLIAAA